MLITCAADAESLDFLVVDDFAPPWTCEMLCRLHARNPSLYEQPREEFWRGRLIGYRDIDRLDFWAAIRVRHMIVAASQAVRGFYDTSTLYADVVHLVGWREGQSMPTHADNAHADGTPHEFAHRAYSGVLYLNDDYEGGELYLPRQDITIRPKRGMLVSLPAGLSHEHAVTRIERGSRTTMAFFLTHDHAIADRTLY